MQRPHGINPREELRKRAASRLLSQYETLKWRSKPASIVRVDAKRMIDQFLETESPTTPRPERDQLCLELIADLFGGGPLEELFADETILEILILGHDSVLARRGDSWQPMNVRFRDADHLMVLLTRWQETAEPVIAGAASDAGFDLKLPNGFRLIAVVPPAVLEQPPRAVLLRGKPIPKTMTSANIPNPAMRSSTTQSPAPGRTSNSASISQSSVTRNPQPAQAPIPQPSFGGSDKISFKATIRTSPSSSQSSTNLGSGRMADPYERFRMRITERLITRLAAAGVYDLSQLPTDELRKVIVMYVQEFATAEAMTIDDPTQLRLANEILAAMNR